MKKHIITIILSVILISLDQISKYLFYDQNYLNNLNIIHPTFNTWISRSLPIPQLITIILTIWIIVYLIKLYLKNQISKRIIIFIIWWAIWNLIDRVYLWWVKDFILIFNRFPIFNLADIFINIWAILVIFKQLNIKWQKSSWKMKNY
jgi:lipoprotein signal peptidase